jgi:hypothetical protein
MSRTDLNTRLQNCITGLAEAVNALEQPGTKPVGRTVARRLRALIESGGQTNNPRHSVGVDRH